MLMRATLAAVPLVVTTELYSEIEEAFAASSSYPSTASAAKRGVSFEGHDDGIKLGASIACTRGIREGATCQLSSRIGENPP